MNWCSSGPIRDVLGRELDPLAPSYGEGAKDRQEVVTTHESTEILENRASKI